MIYQLPNGRIIELSIEEYLSLTDEEIRDLNGLSNDYTSDITNPFYKSALKNKQKKEKETLDPHEKEPNLDEIKDIDKMGDSYFHRDDV